MNNKNKTKSTKENSGPSGSILIIKITGVEVKAGIVLEAKKYRFKTPKNINNHTNRYGAPH